MPPDLQNLALALALGVLVGLQREWVRDSLAGIRTFPLITLLGALATLLARTHGGWVIGAGFLGLTALMVMGNFLALRHEDEPSPTPGTTTEVAALLMYSVGGILMAGHSAVGVVVGGIVAVLLHLKGQLHGLVTRIGEEDLKALIQLVLIGMVILPVIPSHAMGPYGVLNPFKIWLMVVLIVGISLGAYVAYKLLGERVGTLLAGILGGLISSTATTASYSRQVKEAPETAPSATVVLTLASTIVYGRVLVEIYVVAPEQFGALAPPLVVVMAFMILLAVGTYLLARGGVGKREKDEPPSTLGVAIGFGVLYAAVLVGIAIAKQSFGDIGLYTVAVLSGLTDVDAITMSITQMVQGGGLTTDIGWRLILVGAGSNMVFKAGLAMSLGTRELGRRIGVVFGLGLAASAAVLVLWP